VKPTHPVAKEEPSFEMSEMKSQADEAGESMPESQETPRQALCRDLKERVARGDYWVDLDFLACLLVDSRADFEHDNWPISP
jgi:hypothetical protein